MNAFGPGNYVYIPFFVSQRPKLMSLEKAIYYSLVNSAESQKYVVQRSYFPADKEF